MRDDRDERLFMALHFESPAARELAFEAFWARQRGELERSVVLVDAAVRAHVAYARSGAEDDGMRCARSDLEGSALELRGLELAARAGR